MKRLLVATVALLASAGISWGQQAQRVIPLAGTALNTLAPITNTNPMPVSIGGTGGSISPFAPGGVYATVTATGSSADATLPVGTAVVLSNTGTTVVSCNLTVGAGTSTTNKTIIQPASWVGLAVGLNTHFSCIDQTAADTTSNLIVASGGTGLPTGSGGGGGSGSGGTATSTITNGTVTLGGTFQSVLASSALRKGCTLQDTGTHPMWVYFGANGSATTANSLIIQPGQTISCNSGSIVLTDNVSITGTTADTWVMNAQ